MARAKWLRGEGAPPFGLGCRLLLTLCPHDLPVSAREIGEDRHFRFAQFAPGRGSGTTLILAETLAAVELHHRVQ